MVSADAGNAAVPIPYEFFEPLAKNVETALLFKEELENANGWIPTWCPVFWTQTGGFVVDTATLSGEVWRVDVDFASETRVADTLNELVVDVIDKFRDGTYFFDPDHGIQSR